MIIKNIVIHHSASGLNTTVEQVDQWHKAKDYPKSSLGFYVGYHYFILKDGKIVQTRRDNELGAHSPPNDGKIGICLAGNFMLQEPTAEQTKSLTELVGKLKTMYNINYVRAHRDFNKTDCPGNNLYKFSLIDQISWLRKLINILLNNK